MKSIVITCMFFLLAIASHSQITVKEQPKKIAQPVNMKIITNRHQANNQRRVKI